MGACAVLSCVQLRVAGTWADSVVRLAGALAQVIDHFGKLADPLVCKVVARSAHRVRTVTTSRPLDSAAALRVRARAFSANLIDLAVSERVNDFDTPGIGI